MLTIGKIYSNDGPEYLEEKLVVCLDFKDKGYIMDFNFKSIGQLIVWLFNRKAIRPFDIYSN